MQKHAFFSLLFKKKKKIEISEQDNARDVCRFASAIFVNTQRFAKAIE